jgi:hypothetical protein
MSGQPTTNPHVFPDYLEDVLYRLDDYGCTRLWWERYVRDLRAAIARYGEAQKAIGRNIEAELNSND